MKKIFSKNKKNTRSTARKKSSLRRSIDLAVLACVILLGVSGYLWWTKIMMNPDRALSDALAKDLQTRSITKSVDQSGVTGGIKQTTYLTFFPEAVQSQTNTVLTQGIGSNATSVTTETIGTADSDYVRYTAIKGGQNTATPDRFNGILGLWAKRQADPSKGQEATFLNESLFGILPFGYFNEQDRTDLLAMITQKKIYKYTAVKKEFQNKRPVYVYDMSISPADLVEVIREYVRLSGSASSSQLDPAQYKGFGDVKVKLTIDILSRQVTRVQYSTGRIENYTGQNLYRKIDIPAETIPVEELQKRLQGQNA